MTEQANIANIPAATLAELRRFAEACEDRELARKIYAGLRHISHKLAVKHRFPAEYRVKERRA